MNIITVHNRYLIPGGEDVVFEEESTLLRQQGHSVLQMRFDNHQILKNRSVLDSVTLAASTIWSVTGAKRLRNSARSFLPDLVHFHNTFPIVSPGAYSAVHQPGVAVVQTLHNYRLICPSATLYRDGHPCEDCLGKTPPYPGVVHGCYRDSSSQTAVVATMLTAHRFRRTWSRDVDRYIALTEFAKRKLVQGGLPKQLIAVKPNFVTDSKSLNVPASGSFIFVGRLAAEKGVPTLLSTRHELPAHLTVRVIGDGPLMDQVRAAAESGPGIDVLGRLPSESVISEMQSALALIFPSTWYEGFPMTIVEAFSQGLPVIASKLGSMAEIIEDGTTGLLFEPGDAADLARKIIWAAEHPGKMRRMGENARKEYESKYTPDRNYDMLMDIYQQAMDHAAATQHK